jgi:cytochrome c oxidase subunit 4
MSEQKIHVIPLKIYIAVAAGLLILTGITVSVSFIDFGAYNVTIALVIASIKALLVAFFFMHLLWDNKLYLIIFAASLLFLTIFLTFTMFDTTTRDAIYIEKAVPINPESSIYKQKNNN